MAGGSKPVPVRRKTEAEVRVESAPHRPADYTIEEVMAIKMLQEGKAQPHQQVLALKWIIEKAACTHDVSYRPGGIEGQRATDFAEGKAYVGRQIIKLIKLDKAKVKPK